MLESPLLITIPIQTFFGLETMAAVFECISINEAILANLNPLSHQAMQKSSKLEENDRQSKISRVIEWLRMPSSNVNRTH